MIQILKNTRNDVVSLKVKNVVKREDYLKIKPVVEKTKETHGKIKLLIDTGNLQGIILTAFWEDLKMRLNADNIDKIAVIVSIKHINDILKKPQAPLIGPEIKTFENKSDADQWITNLN